jgi:hypothetical protein
LPEIQDALGEDIRAPTDATAAADRTTLVTGQTPDEPQQVGPESSASHLYTSLLASHRVSDSLEFGASLDFPLDTPQLYATLWTYHGSEHLPSALLGGINTLSVDNYKMPGLFALSRTSLWGVLSKTFYTQHRLQVSAGGVRAWQDGRLRPISTADLTLSSRLRLRVSYYAGRVYPGASVRASDQLWLRGTFLTDQNSVSIRAQWRPPSSFDF